MKKKRILIEGTINFPLEELHKMAEEKGIFIRPCWKFENFRKKGEHSLKKFDAIFLGPRPHSTKGGGSGNINALHGETFEGTKIFVCSAFNSKKQIKITKSSFRRALKEFLNSE